MLFKTIHIEKRIDNFMRENIAFDLFTKVLQDMAKELKNKLSDMDIPETYHVKITIKDPDEVLPETNDRF